MAVDLARVVADLHRTLAALVAELTRGPDEWEAIAFRGLAIDAPQTITGPALMGALIETTGTEVEAYDMESAPSNVATLKPSELRMIVAPGASFAGNTPIKMRRGIILRAVTSVADVTVVYRRLTRQQAEEEPGP